MVKKKKMIERTLLQILVLLDQRPLGLQPYEIGQSVGPSWRSGTEWSGPYLRELQRSGFIRITTDERQRYVHITEEGRAYLVQSRKNGCLLQATWRVSKQWEFAILQELAHLRSPINADQVRHRVDADKGLQHFRAILLRLQRRGLVEVTERHSGARPMKLFKISADGRRALHAATAYDSSNTSVEIHRTERVIGTTHGDATG